MGLFHIWVPIFLFLFALISLAYPFDTRSSNLILTPPQAISHVNLTSLGQGYPVYPVVCFHPSTRGRRQLPSKILSDCSWLLNEDLLKQDSLLFQDLIFSYSQFEDQSGKRYPSRWRHGQCFISVGCVWGGQQQKLHLFNVVLAANKILKTCIEDKRIPAGGTISIGSLQNDFFVDVRGLQDSDAVNESNIPLLSNRDLPGRDMKRSQLHKTSNPESPLENRDAIDSTAYLPPSVAVEKRDSDLQHGSSPSTDAQDSKLKGALSLLNPIKPSANSPGSLQAPADYPVSCFNPYHTEMKRAALSDCNFIIDEIILRYPNPFSPQTFGFTPAADINLSLKENEKWTFGRCIIFVRNMDKTRTDTFRIVDVATTAHRIMAQCVAGARYPLGGTACVGSIDHNFYVSVGGAPSVANSSISRVDPAEERIGTHGVL